MKLDERLMKVMWHKLYIRKKLCMCQKTDISRSKYSRLSGFGVLSFKLGCLQVDMKLSLRNF